MGKGGKTNITTMPIFSFLDPQFDFELVLHTLNNVEDFIVDQEEEVRTDYDKWSKISVLSNESEEYRQWQEDNFVDEMFYASELKRNLLNGLAVTTNTIFERHINLVVRETINKLGSNNFIEKHTYSLKELREILTTFGHPNINSIKLKNFDTANVYKEIRNCIIHHDGVISDLNTVVWKFVLSNKQLFDIQQVDKETLKISITVDYIKIVISELNKLFRLLLYKNDGKIIYF